MPKSDVVVQGNGPVMVVDDNADEQFITRKCFERTRLAHYDLVFLESGQRLLDYLQDVRAERSPLPALVLLDINMPGLTGFETLERLRRMPEFARVPIVLIFTNSTAAADRARSLRLGANGFQTKPTSIRDYVQFFDSLAS